MKLSFVAIVFLCGSQVLAGPDINRIIGENDLVLVSANSSNVPLKYRNLIDAVGLMSMGCTATHIGKGYVLTAAHCFFVGDKKLHRDLNCSEVRIEWGVRDGVTPYLVSECEKIKAIQLNGRSDFAILKVTPIPTATIEVDFSTLPLPGDALTVFSHPEEQPLHWSKVCAVLEPKAHPKIPAETMHHSCDTGQGSSGAGMLSPQTLKIVGIHAGGKSDAVTKVNYASFLTNTEIADILTELGFK